MKMQRPNEILKVLREHGYEAYYVGGCVRDTLLGRNVHDWDITTSALPEQIMACFDHCIPTGIKHGTVTVLLENTQAEVTTYRTDGVYCDGRHPQQVSFVRQLSQDLARRDFTINAMAMDENGDIVDLYGGQNDLKKKLIRCVGDPDVRFAEDALRMLRAVRFSAQLDFSIDPATLGAIKRNASLCNTLSAERVRDEIEKTICSSRPERMDHMAELGIVERCAPSCLCSCRWLARLPAEPIIRWSALCRTWRDLDLSVLRLSKRMTLDAIAAGRCDIPQSTVEWKKLIAEQGRAVALIAATLSEQKNVVEQILSSGDCLSLRQLAVSGKDFPSLSGPDLGEHLKRLLQHVLEHPEDNQRDILINLF